MVTSKKDRLIGRAFWLALWWFWMPVLLGLAWLFTVIITPGLGDWRRDLELGIKNQLFPAGWNLLNAAALFWIMIVIGFIGTIVIVMSALPGGKSKDKDHSKTKPDDNSEPETGKEPSYGGVITSLIVCSLVIGIGGISFVVTLVNNDKDEARYYNEATTFYTPTLDRNKAPSGVQDLLDGARVGDKGAWCQRVGKHDVPSCIRQGELPVDGWEARSSSLAGATYFLAKKTGDKSGVDLLSETVTYLYSKDRVGGKWTGIRDGSGKRTPIYGVVEWTGTGNPTECYFNRDGYNLDRALRGDTRNSLVNLIAERYRPYLWDNGDAWGYCEGSKPVIVIPMKQIISYNNRTVEAPAGVLIIRGSESGEPDFDFKKTVKAGELPGPVYPLSLVSKQRDMVQWAAGRRAKKQSNFGFEATDADSQMGNAVEYLLRDKKSGRLYWVSPLTPRGDSQLFVSYAITPADEVNNHSLNPLRVYVLAVNDPRRVDLNTLDNTVKQVVGVQDAGFIPSGGKIIEYLPLDSTTWQVFAERGGAPVYVITIPVGATRVNPTIATITQDGTVLQPRAVELSGNSPQTPSGQSDRPTGIGNCGKPVVAMSESELVGCLAGFADEYSRRHPN